MKLFRVMSNAEKQDYRFFNGFRTGINTLEAKQFFKSETGVKDFYLHSIAQNYQPPYVYLIIIDIFEECLATIQFDEQELDRFEALTVFEKDLTRFNNCINFTELHEL